MGTRNRTILIVVAFLFAGQAHAENWKAIVSKRLPEFGHRNWIVVVDSAYPKQSAPGIETVNTGAGQLDVLRYVLTAIDAARHVQPKIMLDAELSSVPEKHAPGVEEYRTELKKLFEKRSVLTRQHEEIIGDLDEGARQFQILILKTDMTIPYTSVFIELECGYWTAEKETALRDAMNAARKEK